MGLSSLPAEVQISLIGILLIAVAGCTAALHSWMRISGETKGVIRAETALTGDAAWEGAYRHDNLKLAVWLRDKGIKPNSHVGDIIRTCWSAWLCGRSASLTELHTLVARRERSHVSTRLSAGIAALLLVFGIVGTLSSIKPVLRDFKFQIATESSNTTTGRETRSNSDEEETAKDAASVAANTDLVNTLIHNLGNAFWPSLFALLGTIAVVSCRGLYSLSLHRFTLELDRFAVDTLVPRYRITSLSEQYQELRATLATLAESILQREGRFHKAVEHLESLVVGISPALSGLAAAANASKGAAEGLSSRAKSISEGLTRHLGAKSHIYRAIAGFEAIFKKTEESLSNLSSVIDGIGHTNTADRKELELAIQALAQSVASIAKDQQFNQSEAKTALKAFQDSLVGIPAVIHTTSEKAVDAGITAVKVTVAQLHDEQKRWHAGSAEELKTTTISALAGVKDAGQELAAQAEKFGTVVSDIGNITKDARAAFQELTDAGKAQITQMGDSANSKIEGAAGKLKEEAGNIGVVVERLSKLQLDIGVYTEYRRSDTTGRNIADGDGSINNSVPVQGVDETPIVASPPGASGTEKLFVPTDNSTDSDSSASAEKPWYLRNPFSGKKT